MRRYLPVLDADLLAMDDKLDLAPISYLAGQQQQEPAEVVVLSLVGSGQPKLSPLELVPGGPAAAYSPRPSSRLRSGPTMTAARAAEHRMNLTVRHLTTIGCQASAVQR